MTNLLFLRTQFHLSIYGDSLNEHDLLKKERPAPEGDARKTNRWSCRHVKSERVEPPNGLGEDPAPKAPADGLGPVLGKCPKKFPISSTSSCCTQKISVLLPYTKIHLTTVHNIIEFYI